MTERVAAGALDAGGSHPHPAPPGPTADVHRAILQALKECGVSLAASLPDDWVAPLADLLDAEPTIASVRVAREPAPRHTGVPDREHAGRRARPAGLPGGAGPAAGAAPGDAGAAV